MRYVKAFEFVFCKVHESSSIVNVTLINLTHTTPVVVFVVHTFLKTNQIKRVYYKSVYIFNICKHLLAIKSDLKSQSAQETDFA